MRGPLLSGPLGSAATLAALARWLRGAAPAVVVGPLWLAAALAREIPIIALIEPEQRAAARRAAKRGRAAAGDATALTLVEAAEEIPLRRGGAGALVVEGAASLDSSTAMGWLLRLAPCLRPEGRLVAMDAVKDPASEARVAGVFLAAALGNLVQERPREGVVVTVGVTPCLAVGEARWAGEAAAAAAGLTGP